MLAVALVACSGSSQKGVQASEPTLPKESPTQAQAATPTPTTVLPTATSESSPTPTATPTEPPSPTATPAPVVVATQPPPVPSGPTSLTIQVTNFQFTPNSVVVASGETVTVHFVNHDSGILHNVAFDLSELQFTTPCAGTCEADTSFTAPSPGQYSFSCSVHPFMTGTLIVN